MRYCIYSSIWLIPFLFYILSPLQTYSQKNRNYVDIQISDDNAGEISNWLNTGDDLGDGFSFKVEINIAAIHPKYNFSVKWESAEFSALDLRTVEPRDILFDELNNYQLTFDNNKLRDRTFFYEFSVGLLYIQSSRIFIGATGLKYFFHNEILTRNYPGRYWIYNLSDEPDHYFPYLDLSYGYTISFFQTTHFALETISKAGLQLSNDFNFTGVHAKIDINNRFLILKKWLSEINIVLKGFYQTNLVEYQIADGELGVKVCWNHVALYVNVRKPFLKNLNNPFIRYNDMELLFGAGLTVMI